MRLLFIQILLILICSNLLSQNKLNLKQCLEYAFEHNLEIEQYANNIDKANVSITQSHFNFLPSVNAEYSHFLNFGRSLNVETYSWENEDIKQGNISLTADLVIFQGLYDMYNRKSINLIKDISNLELSHKRLLIGLEITTLFHKIVLTKSNIEILEITNLNTSKEIEKLNDQILAGTMPKSNIYEIQAQSKREQIEIISLKNENNKEVTELSKLLNWQENEKLQLNTTLLSALNDTILKNSYSIELIVNNSILAVIAAKDIEQLNNTIHIQKSYLYPKLSANALLTSRYQKDIINPVSATEKYDYFSQLKDNQYKQVALTLSIPIFNRYQKISEIKLSEIKKKNKEIEYEKVKQQLSTELQNIQNDIEYLEKKIEESAKMTEAYKKSFEVASEKYRSGLLDSYTLNSSKNNYISSLLQINKLKIELLMNIELLKLYFKFTIG